MFEELISFTGVGSTDADVSASSAFVGTSIARSTKEESRLKKLYI